MKVISIWQPWTSLVVHGFKLFETRTWAPPASAVGERIGIASTKNITPDQRSAFADPLMQRYYAETGLPSLEELPRGYLLGTVLLHSVELITEEFLDDITEEERSYGWYHLGNYAWRLRYPQLLEHPIPIQGKQGLYEWKGLDRAAQEADTQEANGQATQAARQEGSTPLRGRLHLA
ncbi:ASCH domain-containing protein [Shinella zoogloeoides]|uniref:ASCH domain-containing protein n=1 Tax=Shinella zoogloeoides TaxID=352475 RepID=UPI00273DC2B8|nr:ASCH domain-containing protein [Shinella zoogloeoides]WLR90879.1 ASCH domain-containing protein [Shinella zoogloeoides]